MLGSEYHWLVSANPTPQGQVQVRLAGGGALLTLAVALFCVACFAAVRADLPTKPVAALVAPGAAARP